MTSADQHRAQRLWHALAGPRTTAIGIPARDGPRGRRKPGPSVHPTGFRTSPYADIKPPGEDTEIAARRAAAPRKLRHSSPGSSGH